jgi:adenylyltransferase/sulfurtransferase
MSNRESVDAALTRARVLIVGVGGLGAPAAMALAAAGVGSLGLVDPDRVEVSNLHRQPLYAEDDVGRLKVEAAAERLRHAHPALRVETRAERFGPAHGQLAHAFDLVVDGTDTVSAKFVVSDVAVATGVPLVHAGALGFCAQILTVLPGASACYRCVFEEPPPPEETPSCEVAGVLGPAVALAGTLVAAEALRVLSGRRAAFADRLLAMDLRAGTWRTIPVTRNPACTVCGTDPAGRAARRSEAR